MKRKVLSALMIVTLIILGWVVISNADENQSVPTQIVDAGVVLTQQNIDTIEKDKAYRNDQLVNGNYIVSTANAAINVDNSNEYQLQQSLLALASQNPPIVSAVAVCNSNPSLYCPGWGTRRAVNWDAIAAEMATGVNWPTALNNIGLNWSTVNEASGINWSSLNLSPNGINWNDWTKQESQGVNWSQWLYNGGK